MSEHTSDAGQSRDRYDMADGDQVIRSSRRVDSEDSRANLHSSRLSATKEEEGDGMMGIQETFEEFLEDHDDQKKPAGTDKKKESGSSKDKKASDEGDRKERKKKRKHRKGAASGSLRSDSDSDGSDGRSEADSAARRSTDARDGPRPNMVDTGVQSENGWPFNTSYLAHPSFGAGPAAGAKVLPSYAQLQPGVGKPQGYPSAMGYGGAPRYGVQPQYMTMGKTLQYPSQTLQYPSQTLQYPGQTLQYPGQTLSLTGTYQGGAPGYPQVQSNAIMPYVPTGVSGIYGSVPPAPVLKSRQAIYAQRVAGGTVPQGSSMGVYARGASATDSQASRRSRTSRRSRGSQGSSATGFFGSTGGGKHEKKRTDSAAPFLPPASEAGGVMPYYPGGDVAPQPAVSLGGSARFMYDVYDPMPPGYRVNVQPVQEAQQWFPLAIHFRSAE